MTSQIESASTGSKAITSSTNNITDDHSERSSLVDPPHLATGDPRDDQPNTARCSSLNFLTTLWWKEIISFLVASGALVAIVVILVMYNGQVQPSWKYSVNLSTLIAILSTLLRALLVAVVEEGKKLQSNGLS